MKRVIKLLIYYLAYTFGIGWLFYGGYMIAHRTLEMPPVTDPAFFNLSVWAQLLATLAVGVHLLVWGYVRRDDLKLNFPNAGKVMLVAAVFIVGMGFWTNYLTELTRLPDNLKAVFEMSMNHPAGIVSIVFLAPVVEELLLRGAIQGHLMRIWKNPAWAIVLSSLIFGLMHGNPVQIFFAFLTGVALGWMYCRTGSLLPGMLMHFINNGSSVLLYHLSGGSDETMAESLGTYGAAGLALAGVALTVLCVWLVKARLVPRQMTWHAAAGTEKNKEENELTL
ncbi:type II CAAX endopeptidase family protein [Bacteroides gallinaceum]|uniref:CPBP family intramembrane glutamic endopeptidase n=1 Tax=Bacteroides gallinaceum TaxID=1462571 RepID=UPI001DC2B605|nr:type II CAAX endopeptidase family protein [Bacteroides gallinaceum]MBW9200537.1 CPBP family intramembrane metalloprotease [Bacteroidales bacterium SW299]MDM8207832.1 type II CAAX endopeptidase family protein [Bacteroides gallinaceum]